MKAKWIIDSDFPYGTKDKVYQVLSECYVGKNKDLWYEIINDMDDTCFFPAAYFEIQK